MKSIILIIYEVGFHPNFTMFIKVNWRGLSNYGMQCVFLEAYLFRQMFHKIMAIALQRDFM